MATNRWRIILDNFPKYFSERVRFIYGYSVAIHAVSHMRATWEHQMRVDTEAEGHLALKGDIESIYGYDHEIEGRLTTYGDTTSAYKVELSAVPRIGTTGELNHAMKVDVNVRMRNNIYCRIELQSRVDLEDVEAHLALHGDMESRSKVDVEITPRTALTGDVLIDFQYASEVLGYLFMTGVMKPGTSWVQMNVEAMVAVFYKLFERNDEILADMNDLTLTDFVIKEIY